LQLLDELLSKNPNLKIGYFSGEERPSQIIERFERLGLKNLKLDENFFVYFTTSLEDVISTAEQN